MFSLFCVAYSELTLRKLSDRLQELSRVRYLRKYLLNKPPNERTTHYVTFTHAPTVAKRHRVADETPIMTELVVSLHNDVINCDRCGVLIQPYHHDDRSPEGFVQHCSDCQGMMWCLHCSNTDAKNEHYATVIRSTSECRVSKNLMNGLVIPHLKSNVCRECGLTAMDVLHKSCIEPTLRDSMMMQYTQIVDAKYSLPSGELPAISLTDSLTSSYRKVHKVITNPSLTDEQKIEKLGSAYQCLVAIGLDKLGRHDIVTSSTQPKQPTTSSSSSLVTTTPCDVNDVNTIFRSSEYAILQCSAICDLIIEYADPQLLRCANCVVYYCSRTCQKKHWPKHGNIYQECKKIQSTPKNKSN
jgi:hypothetical protein